MTADFCTYLICKTKSVTRIFGVSSADTYPLTVGFETVFSSSQNKMSLKDANKTIILPDFYFGNSGVLMALKSEVSAAGYINFQVCLMDTTET